MWIIHLLIFQVPSSTTDSVLIDRTSLAAEGMFTCEVSIKPTFETKTGSGQLKVGRKPRIKVPIVQMLDENGRVIKGRLRRYKEGETLNLNCTSVGGYPTPNITWFINGEKVSLQFWESYSELYELFVKQVVSNCLIFFP